MAFYHTACFVFTVMIICNAILYPNIFSSIFKQWFGGPSPKQEKEAVPEYPPHMRHGRGRGGRMSSGAGLGGANRPDVAGSRPGPAGDSSVFMAHQQQESSRGKGMMGTVLPVYAVGIFIYFGYVIYKVFLRDKPVSRTPRPTWGVQEESYQEGPSPQRQQEEALQSQLAAELKAANYPEWKQKKNERRTRNGPEGTLHSAVNQGSEEEVDMLRKRLEETEKTMQRMMDMMNSMGVAMNQVTQHIASNEKPIGVKGLSRLDEVDNDDDDHDSIDVSEEEDLIVGDGIDVSLDDVSDNEASVDIPPKDSLVCEDVQHGKENEVNYVDHDSEEEECTRPEVQNIGAVQDVDAVPETLRRRNNVKTDSSEEQGIEG